MKTPTGRDPAVHVDKDGVGEDDVDEDGDEENTVFVSETHRGEHGRKNTANTAMVMGELCQLAIFPKRRTS